LPFASDEHDLLGVGWGVFASAFLIFSHHERAFPNCETCLLASLRDFLWVELAEDDFDFLLRRSCMSRGRIVAFFWLSNGSTAGDIIPLCRDRNRRAKIMAGETAEQAIFVNGICMDSGEARERRDEEFGRSPRFRLMPPTTADECSRARWNWIRAHCGVRNAVY